VKSTAKTLPICTPRARAEAVGVEEVDGVAGDVLVEVEATSDT